MNTNWLLMEVQALPHYYLWVIFSSTLSYPPPHTNKPSCGCSNQQRHKTEGIPMEQNTQPSLGRAVCP